jgi:hypothetical protein
MGLLLDELDAVFSSFVERHLVVFDDEGQHFGHQLEVRNSCEFIHAVYELLAFFKLAKLLDRVRAIFVFGRCKKKDLVGDGVQTGNLLQQFVIIFGSILHTFLVFFDELIAFF